MKQRIIRKMYQDSGYHKELIGLFLLIIVTVIIEMITIPYITRRILNHDIPEGNRNGLILFGLFYVLVIASQCYMVLKHCEMRCILQRKIQRDLRGKVFQKLQKVQMKFYDDNTTGTILQFLQEDVNQAGQFFPKIITEMIFMGLIRFGIIVIFLMMIDMKITCRMVMLYIIGLIITLFFNQKTIKEIHKIRKMNIEIYTDINEGIKGFLTIKTLNITQEKEKELQKKLQAYVTTNETLEKTITLYHSIFSFIISFSTAIIIYYGGINILQGVGLYAEIMLLMDFNESLKHNFDWFIRHITNFHRSIISYSKILEMIQLDKVEDIEEGRVLKKIQTIEFKDVNFSYGDEKNIQHFSLLVGENEKVALVGKTGSGKTTITNLLCRFYEPSQGKILINGKDYQEYSITSLRNKIGYILQETQIIPTTIIDNIKYANPNITIKEVEDIFKRLKLHDKIRTLKDGYNTNLCDDPDVLSTGEKQLINFARIMAINPDVVILDEVTSNLSYESELLVKHAIEEITKGKIVFIIAHRLTTIKNCNHIVVIKDGKIQEEGNHSELLKQQGAYYQLIQSRAEKNPFLCSKAGN